MADPVEDYQSLIRRIFISSKNLRESIQKTNKNVYTIFYNSMIQFTQFCISLTALLHLTRPVKSKRMSSVCLDAPTSPPRLCVATGWGRVTQSGSLSNTLRQIRIPLHNNTLCKTKYGPSVQIHDGHLCAGKLDGSTGTCVVWHIFNLILFIVFFYYEINESIIKNS